MNDDELAALLPPIPRDAHKYTRGSLLVLAGSARFPGAAVLAARAAVRAGAGYVTLAVPEPAAATARAHLLSIPVLPAPATEGAFAADAWDALRSKLNHVDAIVLGPGLTTVPSAAVFIETVLRGATTWGANCPVLLDADALNLLAVPTPSPSVPAPSPTLVLTPHAGELARLLNATGAADVQQLAETLNAIVVAKGPETCIVSPTQSYCSTAGTPALAKAGTGDVLSGVIGSLLAQGAAPFDAALLGVELHGRAGRLAEARFSQRAVCPEDVIESLPTILKQLEKR
ncbi:MAG: NAD(P)H-hydrate dehydratase [Coriobacteriales bacterium]|jgi:NAD(P)H-hydrate epimerase|nr:NAD(P)H-hydrate dehydratase [Coriobacteriales bacterium]